MGMGEVVEHLNFPSMKRVPISLISMLLIINKLKGLSIIEYLSVSGQIIISAYTV